MPQDPGCFNVSEDTMPIIISQSPKQKKSKHNSTRQIPYSLSLTVKARYRWAWSFKEAQKKVAWMGIWVGINSFKRNNSSVAHPTETKTSNSFQVHCQPTLGWMARGKPSQSHWVATHSLLQMTCTSGHLLGTWQGAGSFTYTLCLLAFHQRERNPPKTRNKHED